MRKLKYVNIFVNIYLSMIIYVYICLLKRNYIDVYSNFVVFIFFVPAGMINHYKKKKNKRIMFEIV